MSLTSADIEKFLTVLKQSGLVEESVAHSAASQYTEVVEPPTLEGFAAALVEKKLITSWHASKLLKGKHKGFFLGKYKLLRLIGKGGMSSVYLAEHINMKRQCAVKVLPYKLVTDSSYLPRFYREAQAVAALDHRNIVRAYDVDHETDGEMEIHFLVMEYVTGLNFYELVKTKGPLAPTQAAEYIRQGALGLEHAHEAGMVHRDIKPGNFLIDNTGTVKLMDLGLAMVLQENKDFSVTLENEEKVLGTADYLAPEQAVDSHLVDSRADIYALGCTFYFLLTGRPPFDEGTLAQRLLAHQSKQPPDLNELREGIPSELVKIINKMMQKDPENRIQTAAEVAEQLQNWLDHPDAEESSDSFPHIIIDPEAPDSSTDNPTGAISEFLSHLDVNSGENAESPTNSRQASKAYNQEKSPSDSGVSVFNSGASSIVSSKKTINSQASRKQLKKKLGMKPINAILFAVAIIAGLAAIYTFTRDSDPKKTEIVGPNPPPIVQVTIKKLKNETVIVVGPQGDFTLISDAINYLLDSNNSESAAKIHEIRVSANQTIEDSLRIVNSGFETLPQPLLIRGEGPKLPVLKSSSGPVITLDSIEELTISNFKIDCTDQPVGIELSGYLTGTSLQNLSFINLTEVGVHASGASGLVGQPLTISNCRFEASKDSASGIRCESSETANTRLLNIQGCRFIGPMSKGILFSSPQGSTWDVNISQCIFHKTLSGITFAGKGHDISEVKIANNTFHEFGRGIQFESGPVPASSGITFIQNLFVNGNGFEVSTEVENVSLQQLSTGAINPQSNWTSGEEQESSNWLNIFTENGKLGAEDIEFKSTDPESADFLKPQSAVNSSSPVDGRNYIGAVAP